MKKNSHGTEALPGWLRLSGPIVLLLLGLAAIFSRLSAAGEPLVRISLLSDCASVKPGQKFRLGVRFDIAPGCHIYWKNPGDAGLAPEVHWNLPGGFTAGPLFWPVPEREIEPGELVVNTYQGQVLLYSWVQPPPELQPGELKFGVSAKWLVCRRICVEGSADTSLTLKPGEGGSGENSAVFSHYEKLVPRPADYFPGLSVETSWQNSGAGVNDRLGVVVLRSTEGGEPLLGRVKDAVWFDWPSDNLASGNFHIDREHSNLEQLILHIHVERLEPNLAWPDQWGGVLVTHLKGGEGDSLSYILEVEFDNAEVNP